MGPDNSARGPCSAWTACQTDWAAFLGSESGVASTGMATRTRTGVETRPSGPDAAAFVGSEPGTAAGVRVVPGPGQ
jgi:hypothetical protein